MSHSCCWINNHCYCNGNNSNGQRSQSPPRRVHTRHGSQRRTVSSQISPVGTLLALSPHFTDEDMGPEKVSSSPEVPPTDRLPTLQTQGLGLP